MRICFLATEVFGLGIIGGFGKIVKDLLDELTKRGLETCVATWRYEGQKRIMVIDNRTPIYGASKPSDSLPFFTNLPSILELASLSHICDADVYISIELKDLAFIAQWATGHKKHVIWFQDPYDEKAYKTMALVDPRFKWSLSRKIHFYSTISWLRTACQKADLLLTSAMDFVPVINRLYKPKNTIHHMPNPVAIPDRCMKKASEPTVCFLGRWDPQKRVEMFFELAQKFPDTKFIAMGKSNYPKLDLELRKRQKKLENLEMPGFVSEDEKSQILEKSWVLINTSIREGLPLNFLEACAHKTAILSYVNPDQFASRFGYWVQHGNFELGLTELLKNDSWREKAELGYNYVRRVHNVDSVTDKLLNLLTQM